MLPGASRKICITWYMFPGLDLYYKGPAQHSITRYTSSTVYDLDNLDVGRDMFHAYLVAGLLGWSVGWSVGWLVCWVGWFVGLGFVCSLVGFCCIYDACGFVGSLDGFVSLVGIDGWLVYRVRRLTDWFVG